MPNLLEGYDCGDEPEEEDDSVNDQNDDDESGESENDDISQIKQDEIEENKNEKNNQPQYKDLEPELKMDGDQIEFGEDGFSGQST